MSEKLRIALDSYAFLAGDESHAEGMHRDVTRIRAVSNAARVGYMFSTSRLGQNLDFFDASLEGGDAGSTFAGYFSAWKSLKQKKLRL